MPTSPSTLALEKMFIENFLDFLQSSLLKATPLVWTADLEQSVKGQKATGQLKKAIEQQIDHVMQLGQDQRGEVNREFSAKKSDEAKR